MKAGGIRNRVLAVMVGLVSIFGVAVGAAVIGKIRPMPLGELHEKGRYLSTALAVQCEHVLTHMDVNTLQLEVARYRRMDPDITYIVVFDENARPLISTIPSGVPDWIRTPTSGSWAKELTAASRTTALGPVYEIRTPIKGRLGEVVMAFSERHVEQLAQQALRSVLIFILVLLVAAAWLALVFTRWLTQPIGQLVAGAREIGAGRLGQCLAIERTDEIGELARVLDEMSTNLSQTLVSRDHLNAVVNAMSEALIVTDDAGRIASVNRATVNLTKTAESELIGQSLKTILGPPGGNFLTAHQIVRLAEMERADHFESVLRDRDGRENPVLLSCNLLMVNDQARLVVVARDIRRIRRAQAELEKAHRFSRSILDSITEEISIIDTKTFRIIDANQSFLKAVGRPAEEVIGRPCHAVTHDSDKPCETPDCSCPLTGPPSKSHAVTEHRHQNAQGKDRYVEIATFPIRDDDGTVHHVVHTARDVTERKLARAALEVRARQQAAVAELGHFALATMEPEAFFKRVAHVLQQGLNAEIIVVLEVDAKGNRTVLRAVEGVRDVPPPPETIPYSPETDIAFCLAGNKALTIGDLSNDVRFRTSWAFQAQDARSGLLMPVPGLLNKTRPWGVLGAFTRNNRVFSQNDAFFIQSVATLVSSAVQQQHNETALLERQKEMARQHRQLNQLFDRVTAAKLEWESTMDCMGQMVVLTDAEGRIRRCNGPFRAFAELDYGNLIGQPWREVFPVPCPVEPPAGIVSETEIHDSASDRWYVVTSHPYNDPTNGDRRGAVITIREATDLKKALMALEAAQKEIEERRDRLQEALSRISMLIQRVAAEGKLGIRYENPDILPCYETKRCGKTACPSFGIGVSRCWAVAGTLCGGRVQGDCARKLGDCTRCDVYQHAMANPIHQIGEQFNHMMAILDGKNRELSEAYDQLKHTQSQILQQEKMASIGQLAAGVAHEINNPMGFISSNLGTLGKYATKLADYIHLQDETLRAMDSGELPDAVRAAAKKLKLDYVLADVDDLIRESLDGADRVRTIVKNLKSFSRVDEPEMQRADINACIESTLNIAWNELKYKCTVEKDLGALEPLSCYPQQLNQVFMNLLVNAAHAIDKQGVVTIRSRQDDDAVRVMISDTGCGIPENVRTRIFEPFFTTKEIGKGTGLGLSITYDIVKRHGGEITVDSEVGRGSTFTIRLPRRTDAGAPSADAAPFGETENAKA